VNLRIILPVLAALAALGTGMMDAIAASPEAFMEPALPTPTGLGLEVASFVTPVESTATTIVALEDPVLTESVTVERATPTPALQSLPQVAALEPQLAGFSPHPALSAKVAQTPGVFELTDVTPRDWAFQAVQSLVQDYGCLDGYPDGTFRGDRPMTRFEFAAALNACLNAIVNVRPQDAGTIGQLQSQFATDLATRVDELEARVEELRANQFSTTTRLFGQVIIGFQGRSKNRADFFPVDGIAETEDPGTNLSFFTNAQLTLLTQFSPRSLLLLGLQAGEGNSLFDDASGTLTGLSNNVRLAYEGDTNFNVLVSDLTLRQLVGDRLGLIVGAVGVDPTSVFRGPNRVEGAGSGPLSVFAQRNPVISIGNGQAGLGIDWQISDRLSLQGVYTVPNAANPANGGLFRGDRTLGFQLTAAPTDNLDLAFNYINDFSTTGDLGMGIGDSQVTAGDAVTTNAFGATLAWQLNPRLTLGTWGGYTTSVTPGDPGSVNTTNWMVFANFPDLFGEGHLGGIYIGQPPRISSSTLRQGQNIPDLLTGNLGDPGAQPGATTHVEVFYRYQVNDNLSITPGLIFIFSPSNTPSSGTIAIGALRTTLTF
jgi:hypothetical protein